MKPIFIFAAILLLFSCEKDNPVTNPAAEYLTQHDFYIYEYKAWNTIDDSNITYKVNPKVLIHFNEEDGYIVDQSHKFTWWIIGDHILFGGDFWENLPGFFYTTPMDMFMTFNLGSTPSFSNKRDDVYYSYYMQTGK